MNYSTDLFWTTRKDGIWRGPGHGCGDPYEEGYQRVIEASYKPRTASSSFDTTEAPTMGAEGESGLEESMQHARSRASETDYGVQGLG